MSSTLLVKRGGVVPKSSFPALGQLLPSLGSLSSLRAPRFRVLVVRPLACATGTTTFDSPSLTPASQVLRGPCADSDTDSESPFVHGPCPRLKPLLGFFLQNGGDGKGGLLLVVTARHVVFPRSDNKLYERKFESQSRHAIIVLDNLDFNR